MKKRHSVIIKALIALGGQATLAEISEKTGLNVNGLSQSMASIERYLNLEFIGGKGREQKYKIIK